MESKIRAYVRLRRLLPVDELSPRDREFWESGAETTRDDERIVTIGVDTAAGAAAADLRATALKAVADRLVEPNDFARVVRQLRLRGDKQGTASRASKGRPPTQAQLKRLADLQNAVAQYREALVMPPAHWPDYDSELDRVLHNTDGECPCCGGGNIDADDMDGDKELTQRVTCSDCDFIWYERYHFQGAWTEDGSETLDEAKARHGKTGET